MRDFNFWWRLLRPHTLTASIVPVFVGSAYAFYDGCDFHFSLFIAMLIASMLIQVATNLFNEYYDYVRGLDTDQSVGISGTIVHDGASPKFVLSMALLCYLIAALLGVYICIKTSWILAFIGALCMLIGYLYTGGPFPISATPFGEIFAGGFLGTGVICISFYIQTGFVSADCVLISFPIFILIGLILTANNLRDRVGDTIGGRHTLAILLGHNGTVKFMAACFAICYLFPIFLLLKGFPPTILLPLLSIKMPLTVLRKFKDENQTPKQMMPAMGMTAKTNSRYGLLYALGIFSSAFFWIIGLI